MAEKNIVLIGFMGCGKSLTSNKLAETLDRQVISTDKLVEQKEGQSIDEIFEKSGEGYFRRIEKEIIKEIADLSGMIIDCGGGVVMDDENMANLKKNGRVIYLSVSPESIYNNIKHRPYRPLLNVVDPLLKITELLAERKPYYEKADVTIDADHRTINQIAEDVLRVLADE